MLESKSKLSNTANCSDEFLASFKQYVSSEVPDSTSLKMMRSAILFQPNIELIPINDTLTTDLRNKLTQLQKYSDRGYLSAHQAFYEIVFLVREISPRLPASLATEIKSTSKYVALALENGLLHFSGSAAAALLMSRQPLTENELDDASRMGRTKVHVIRQPSDDAGIIQALQEARHLGLKLSISGARHSQGGQIASAGSLHLNLDNYRAASLDIENNLLTVQSGAIWGDLIPLLDAHEKSLDVLQVPNYFSVGGTLSVNAHGHNVNSGPVASTVKSLRILLADGRIVNASRNDNAELFGLVLGGYGLFGIILDVVLGVRENAQYYLDFHVVKAREFGSFYEGELRGNPQVRYSHILCSVSSRSFLNELMIARYQEQPSISRPLPILGHTRRQSIERFVSDKLNALYASSSWTRSLAWWLASRVLWRFSKKDQTRNRVMCEPFTHFSNGRTDRSEMLQEYFIPRARLDEFLEAARIILLKKSLPLVMVAVRAVKADLDTFLSYAPKDVFGVVFISHHPTTESEFAYLDNVTQELIDAALDSGGRFYLPYRLAYTAAQLERSYPQIAQFFAKKIQYDPDQRFSNKFYEKYGSF